MRKASETRITLLCSSFSETGTRSPKEKRTLREVKRASLVVLSLSHLQVEIQLEQHCLKNAEEKKWRIQTRRRMASMSLIQCQEENDSELFLLQVTRRMNIMFSMSERPQSHTALFSTLTRIPFRGSLAVGSEMAER